MSWKTVELGTICEIIGGSTPLRTNPDFWENGKINWFTIEDIRRFGRQINQTTQFVTEKALRKTSLKMVPANTVLLCCTASVGEFAISKIPLAMNQQFNGLILKTDKVLPKFLFHYCNILKEKLISVSGSTTINFVAISKLKKITIPLPALPIQQKIVEKLDAIFAEIDKAAVSVEENVKNAEALFQSYLRQVFEQDSEGWKKIYLKDIAEYFNGLTYSPKNVCENGTIVLRSSNIQKDKIDLDDIVRVDSAIKDKLYVKSGDILMCSRNGSQRLVGKTATIDDLNESMTFGTFMMIIRSDNNFFLKWFFKSDLFKRQITSGENTMINQITRYMLDEIVLSLPDVLTQKLISNKISNLFVNTQKLKSNYLSKINELSLEKQSILKQAFNGELVKAA